ncbi:hypothetical protein TRVA0_090S00122 [Trichomonascus vanleenenianus]|uniref:Zn(II)2Cys6 transcription factor n=1 Tax=Trichomonascus vanleenenianus TaxID=2268995 RepID=UPI003ECA70BF
MFKPPIPRPENGAKAAPKPQNGAASKKRLVVACGGCRTKKIKCSADRPACSNCLRLNIPCEYPIVRNRGSRFGYREMMKKRLEALQRYVQFDPSAVTPPRPLTELSVDDLFKRMEHAPLESPSRTGRGSSLFEDSLPPMEIQLHLAELYFTYIHGQTYLFLHRPTFMEKLRQGRVSSALVLALCGLSARYSRHPRLTANQTKAEAYSAGEQITDRARSAIFHEIFDQTPTLETLQALIMVIQHDFFKYRGGKTMMYISLATRLAGNLGFNLDVYPAGSTWVDQECQRRTCWSLLVLDRLAHSSPAWTIQFQREDYIHLQLPCRGSNYENDIPVTTPTLGQLEEAQRKGEPLASADALGVSAYLVQAVMVWCDINKYVMTRQELPPWDATTPFASLRQQLDRVRSNLPPRFQYSKDRLIELHSENHFGQFIHLHALFYLSDCMLHRCVTHYSRIRGAPPEFFSEAARRALASANDMSTMVSDMLHTDDQFIIAPFVAFAIFTVSGIHIANSFSDDEELATKAKQNLAMNLKILVPLREYWYSVGMWCDILKDRYTRRSSQPHIEGEDTLVEDPGSPPLPYVPQDLIASSESASSSSTNNESPHFTTDAPSQVKNEAVEDNLEKTWEIALNKPIVDAINNVLPYSRGVSKNTNAPKSKAPSAAPTAPASPSQFADIFLGSTLPAESQFDGIFDQMTTDWYTDLQKLMG